MKTRQAMSFPLGTFWPISRVKRRWGRTRWRPRVPPGRCRGGDRWCNLRLDGDRRRLYTTVLHSGDLARGRPWFGPMLALTAMTSTSTWDKRTSCCSKAWTWLLSISSSFLDYKRWRRYQCLNILIRKGHNDTFWNQERLRLNLNYTLNLGSLSSRRPTSGCHGKQEQITGKRDNVWFSHCDCQWSVPYSSPITRLWIVGGMLWCKSCLIAWPEWWYMQENEIR